MAVICAVVGAWLIGWGMLLATLPMRPLLLPTDASPPSAPRHRGDPLTLLATTEIAL